MCVLLCLQPLPDVGLRRDVDPQTDATQLERVRRRISDPCLSRTRRLKKTMVGAVITMAMTVAAHAAAPGGLWSARFSHATTRKRMAVWPSVVDHLVPITIIDSQTCLRVMGRYRMQQDVARHPTCSTQVLLARRIAVRDALAFAGADQLRISRNISDAQGPSHCPRSALPQSHRQVLS